VRRQPRRTCIICRRTDAKRALHRIVRTAGGHGVQLDPKGKLPGRGAYLCDDPHCWQRALAGGLDKALKTTLTADERQTLSAFIAALPPQPHLSDLPPDPTAMDTGAAMIA
jgi:hypothetical protein